MAGKTKAQIDFEVNTSQFNNSIKEMNSDIKTLTNQLRLNATQLKGNSDDVDLLKERQSLLSIELQKSVQKIDDTNKMLEQAKLQFGDNSKKVNELNNALIKAKTQEAAIKNELASVEKQVESVTKSFDELSDETEDSSGGFTIMKGALADLTSNVIQGAISQIGGLVSSLFELTEATEEYRSMNAKLEGSANSFGYSIDFATNKYQELYSYLGDSQMATNAVTNLMGLRTSQESLTRLTEGAISVWTAYGDSIPIESLTESINETIQVSKITGTLADALNWAGINEDEFNKKLEKTNTTQERADLIANVLNDTYSASKQTYDELTEGMRNANEQEAKLIETQAEIANTVEPVTNAFTELKTGALESMLPVISFLSEKFLQVKSYLEENKVAAVILTAVLIALATGFGILAGALAIQGLITGVTKAISLLNTTLLANPIVLIVAAIAGLVAAFVYLWNNCEAFRNFWIGLWNNIVDFVSSAKDKIVGFFNGIVSFIKGNWQGILLFIVNPFAGAFKLLYDNCDGFRNKVNDLKEKVVGVFSNIANKLKSVFKFNIELPKLKLPHFSISPKGWGIGDLMKGKIPKLSVQWYAKGGIFTQPTIFSTPTGVKGVGESGSEAVLPLTVLDEKLRNSLNQVLDDRIDNLSNSNDSRVDELINLLKDLRKNGVNTYLNGRKISEETAGTDDKVSGLRSNLIGRGLSLG